MSPAASADRRSVMSNESGRIDFRSIIFRVIHSPLTLLTLLIKPRRPCEQSEAMAAANRLLW